ASEVSRYCERRRAAGWPAARRPVPSLSRTRGLPAPATKHRQSTLRRAQVVLRSRRTTEEDAQGMANADNEHTPGPARGSAGTLDREGRDKSDRGTLKTRPRDDNDQIDPEEYARLLDAY